jgi:hypothetical protein
MTESFNLSVFRPYLNVTCSVELSDLAGLNQIMKYVKRFKLESDETNPVRLELDLTNPVNVPDFKIRYYLGLMAFELSRVGCKITFVEG